MTELENYINHYFGIVDHQELATIGSLFQSETIKKGDYFSKIGKPCLKLSFIKSGMLRIYINTEQKEVTQWISTQGYFVTDLSSFVFDTKARYNIQALVDTEIYTISKEQYATIGKLVPKWHEIEKLFIAKCFILLEDRIFGHLSMTAEERYHLFYTSNKELFQQVPQQYLASLLGMTPETFSRIRKKALS